MTWLVQHGRWEKFLEEWPLLADWLEKRGLKGQSWGWPGGLAWATLLARFGFGEMFAKSGLPILTLTDPCLDLTEHMPRELAEILRGELSSPQYDEYVPQGRWIRLDEVPQGMGLGLVVDLIRQRGLWVRPVVRSTCCLLEWKGGPTSAEMLAWCRGQVRGSPLSDDAGVG